MNPTGCKTIICSEVPEELLHKSVAKKYFKTFGPIVKIIVKPKSKKCIVEYETTEAAEEAYSLANEYEDIEFRIDFHLQPSTKRKSKKEKDADPDWTLDPEVQEELDAMGYIPSKQHNLRPEKMSIDEVAVRKPDGRDVRKVKRQSEGKNSTGKAETDLMQVIKQRALTTEEKFKVLDARDKLIRLRRSKHVDLHDLGVTVGTCPDMCSEKERLMREVQHQVALYEQEVGERTMNHSLAVKQYSRSSADQESPLPHELRNVDVLQMTMGYLMHRIMHLCDSPDVNLAEWFHFLWDRMRSIRKDITQQELCCQGSVALVEQCARFHIHCSARLVAEDAAVFDQKINTENLTKCLQTLKYMYHDLAVKGERCPHEAEFRAYVILLNLNDGNFMWEVQQLQSEIQSSPEIKFALEVYSSIDKNNFMRFFKLVRSTTYLNACILLRYFIQVRTKALRTVVQCYTPRLPHAQFPIEQLTNMLAFEGRASTIDFLEYYGLSISADGQSVVLNKRDFRLSNIPYALDRAVNVIESKRTRSVGEVVCGEGLPPPLFETHTIQNSFIDGYLDLKGFAFVPETIDQKDEVDRGDSYRVQERSRSPLSNDAKSKEAWPLSNDAKSKEAWPLPLGRPKAIEDPAPQDSKSGGFSFAFAMQPRTQQIRERDAKQQQLQLQQRELQLERERIAEEQRQMQEHLERERLELQRQQEEQKRLLEETRVRAEQRRLEAERKHQEEYEAQRMEERKRHELRRIEAERLLQQEQERKRRIQKHFEQEETKRRMLEEDRTRRRLEQEKLCEIRISVEELIKNMLLRVEDKCREDRLEQLRYNTVGRYVLLKWRKKVSFNRRKRKAIDQCPLWMSQMTSSDLARDFYTPNQNLTLNMMKRYKKGVPMTCPIPKMPLIRHIDLATLTCEELIRNALRSKRLQNDIYWKVGLYFTEEKKNLTEAVDVFIGWDQTRVLLKQVKLGQNKFTYCLHQTRLQPDDVNGLVVLVNELSEELIDTLIQFLNKLGDLEPMPIAFVVHQRTPALENEIDLLVKNNMISESVIIESSFSQEDLIRSLEQGIRFLAKYSNPPPGLLLNTLKAFVHENLGLEMYQRMRSYAKWHLPYKKCIAKPLVAIGLFNSALDQLQSIVFHPQRMEHPTFPEIFKEFLSNEIPDYLPCDYKYFPTFWKSKKYDDVLRISLQDLKLPEYQGQWPFDDIEQAEIEHDVLAYCANIFKNPDKVFYKVMAIILKNPEGTSWIDIVEVIMEERMKLIDFRLPVGYRSETIFNQLVVVYQQEDLQKFADDSWFYLKHPLIQSEIELGDDEEDNSGENRPETEVIIVEEDGDININLDAKLQELMQEDNSKVSKCKEALEDFRRLLEDLEESIIIQKQISRKFESNLKSCLESCHSNS